MDINELKKFEIFKNLSDQEVSLFKEKMKKITVPEAENFIVEGDVGDSIYLLLKGNVRINQALTLSMHKGGLDNREKAIINLSANMKPLFGEMSLFDKEDRRSASVNAITECQLSQLMKDDLFSICDENTDIGYKVMKNLAKILSRKVLETNQNVLKLT
ncbi:cyclic nucleotide-binding domain-containing protein, partial [bacterium]